MLGRTRQELDHSAVVAWLLRPTGWHQLGTAFLERFLATTVPGTNFPRLSEAVVRTEVTRQSVRADIVISGRGWKVIVENKVDSPESERQCESLERPVGGASLRTPMTYQDYLALGETKHHEYYDGLCVVNPSSRSHSRALARLVDLIRPLCPESHEVLTGWGWHIGPELDYEPDIMVTDRSSPDDDVLRHPPPRLLCVPLGVGLCPTVGESGGIRVIPS